MANQGTLGQWDQAFLKDIGAKYTPQNVNFLNQWVGREGGMNTLGYNPLYTTLQMPGSANVGSDLGGGTYVQAYPTLAEGAQADANALLGNNPGYAQLLAGFRNNTLNPNASYQGLQTWSGTPGYNTVGGASAVNPNATFAGFMASNPLLGQAALAGQQGAPAVYGAQANTDLTNTLAAQLTQWIQEQSKQANLEAGYQQQGTALNEQDLAAQQAALARQMGLAPQQQAITEKQYGQQFADMLRNYLSNTESNYSGEAGAGNWFSKGAKTDRSNLVAGYKSSYNTLNLQRKSEELNYAEQIKQMKDQQAALHRQAERYGISEEEILTRLAAQLSNIRYGGLSSMYPLMQSNLNDALTIAENQGAFGSPGVGLNDMNTSTAPAPKPKNPGAGGRKS